MDPISTGIGLAASLVTLSALAASSCEVLYDLSKRFQGASKNVRELHDDLESLQTLLSSLEQSGRLLGTNSVGQDLQRLWVTKRERMRQDLHSFGTLMAGLGPLLDKSNPSRCSRVRLLAILSEKTIARYRQKFMEHMSVLGLIQNYLNGCQIQALAAESRLSVDALGRLLKDAQREIEVIPPLLERELPILHSSLSHLGISLNGRLDVISRISEQLNHRLDMASILHNSAGHNFWYQPHSIRAFTAIQNNRASDIASLIPIRARRGRLLSWKWRVFRFPIGTLSIETSQEADDELDKLEELNHTHYISFTFMPPSWIADSIARVSYAILSKGHSIPYWQRIHSGAVSLVPSAIIDALEEGDLLEARGLLSHICPADLTHLASSELTHSLPKQKMIAMAGYRLRITGHGHNPSYELRSINSGNSAGILLRYFHGKEVENGNDGWKQARSIRHANHFAIIGGSAWCELEKESLGQKAFALFGDVERLGTPRAMPSLCLDCTSVSFEVYRRYICEYLDPQSFQELGMLDRWWLGALNISDPRFGQILEAYHLSFRSPLAFQAFKRRSTSIPDELEYCAIVRQVLEAPYAVRQTFLTWLCAMGTAKALQPFINAGFDFGVNRHGLPSSLGMSPRSYLCVAAIFRNNEIMEALRVAGTRIDLTLMACCLPRSLRSIEDVEFVHAIIDGTLPTSREYAEDLPFSPVFRWCSTYANSGFDPTNTLINRLLGAGFGDTKTIVVALLQLGASLDYAGPPKAMRHLTALEWAADLGYLEYVPLLCQGSDSYDDRRTALQSVLALTERNIASSHPRQCLITSSDKLTNWPFDAMQGAFNRKHHVFGGVPLELDLKCHRLILSALLDLADEYSSTANAEKRAQIQAVNPSLGRGHPG
ncbi:hypothetical protein K432DRAFT_450727 [Lepidopterella palustris CBS 459.81]|uniref:Azaphilone pigments biosynthesis cluster protein L N-terminal domain-containing protein n=1 Tax=Lepidopterella palustris CBS 459.81 TaxID=1314670 RepID=A0A8E2JG11_9PEZI|nr:hypothetical protein K432DRAFT_450727 [Lepidopterella palustris CBS 459.81]